MANRQSNIWNQIPLFRSKRFEQYIEPEDDQNKPRKVIYSDLDSNAQYVSSVAVIPRLKLNKSDQLVIRYPRLLHVEQRRLREERFYYITIPLESLFRASIETGNPVIWC